MTTVRERGHSSQARLLAAAVLTLTLSTAGMGNTVRSFMALDGDQGTAPTSGNTSVTINPGETARVMLWLSDASAPGDLLSAYQAIFPDDTTPQPLAVGTVTYVDNPAAPGAGDSVFIDTARADWVLDDQPFDTVAYVESAANSTFGMLGATTVGLGTDPAGNGGIHYLGEFDLTASADACGDFVLSFVTEPGVPPGPQTAFFNQFGGEFVLDRVQNLTVTVPCECLQASDCDDSMMCTIDTCDSNECNNTPVDCSGLDDQCLVGVCNTGDGMCEAQNANEGGACDDGDACTENDACSSGSCGGTAVVCDDGLFCNGDETCDMATGCQPGTAPCPIEACDEVADACNLCTDLADCADTDDDGIRDDACLFYECVANTCISSPRGSGDPGGQADIGGFAGACPVDQICDINDSFHAQNCFGNQDTQMNPGYPCETSTPNPVYNADAGGFAGACPLDGVCDINDVFHSQNCFGDQDTMGNPGYPCTCDGPAPTFGEAAPLRPAPVELTGLTLRTTTEIVRPGDVVEVDVYVDTTLSQLRGYQLHLGVDGGARGNLELVDIVVDDARRDYVYAAADTMPWTIFNTSTSQMMNGLDAAVTTIPKQAYLATYIYRVSKGAAGTFAVQVLHDEVNDVPQDRTFLFATTGDIIGIDSTASALIEVGKSRRSLRTR